MTLQEWIARKAITQAEFAAMIGSTQQSVGRYVNGLRTPAPNVIRRIHAATNGRVTVKDFVDKFGAPLRKESMK